MADDNVAILPHLLGLFTGFLGPLILLLITKNKLLKSHSARALNWQISFIIYALVLIIGTLVLFFSFGTLGIIIGGLLLVILSVLDLVFCIIASIKATKKEIWNYPLTIPFISK